MTIEASLGAIRDLDRVVAICACCCAGALVLLFFLAAAVVEMFINSARREGGVMKRLSEGARTTWIAS